MPNTEFPAAIAALDAAPRRKPSTYPEPFASRMAGREMAVRTQGWDALLKRRPCILYMSK